MNQNQWKVVPNLSQLRRRLFPSLGFGCDVGLAFGCDVGLAFGYDVGLAFGCDVGLAFGCDVGLGSCASAFLM